MIKPAASGFKLLYRGCLRANVSWNCVTGLAGFRQPTLVQDIDGLVIFRGSRSTTINEDMPGWSPLIAAIAARFDIDPNWHSRVASPVGQLNWLRLWGDVPEERA